MLLLFVWIIVFIVALFVLVKASDYFTDAAEKIGLFFGLPSFIIGVTIVAFGTSLPELVSSIIAVMSNSSEIVIGNVIGSNITNIFLVLGITAIINKKINIKHKSLHIDLLLLIISAFLLGATILDGVFNLAEAILCILGIIAYLTYTILTSNKQTKIDLKAEKKSTKIKQKLDWKIIAMLIGSGFFIYLGAKYTVDSIIALSEIINVGKEIIAVSAVALGTSLPELAVSLTAAKKGKGEIAVGNVLGSNIFNALGVMGIPALFGVLIIPPNMLILGLPMMLLATVLFYFISQDREITRKEGFILVAFYIVFLAKLFGLF